MKEKNGFVALTAVLVLSAIFLSVSISIASHAISGSGSNTSLYASHKAKVSAASCVEYALLKMQRTEGYGGNEGILIDEEECEILSVSGTETERSIQVQSSVFEHVYRIEAITDETDPAVMEIASYEAVTNF